MQLILDNKLTTEVKPFSWWLQSHLTFIVIVSPLLWLSRYFLCRLKEFQLEKSDAYKLSTEVSPGSYIYCTGQGLVNTLICRLHHFKAFFQPCTIIGQLIKSLLVLPLNLWLSSTKAPVGQLFCCFKWWHKPYPHPQARIMHRVDKSQKLDILQLTKFKFKTILKRSLKSSRQYHSSYPYLIKDTLNNHIKDLSLGCCKNI